MNGFFAFLKHRWMPMIVAAALFSLIFQSGSFLILQSSAKQRQAGATQEQLQALLNATNKIISQNKEQTDQLTAQNNDIKDLQKLTICLVQFIKGGNYTSDPDCQQRIQNAPQTLEGIQQRQDQHSQPNAQPPFVPSTEPSGSTEIVCVKRILGICVSHQPKNL